MEADLRLLEFPPLDACHDPLFKRRLEGENEKEKICVTAQQMNTSSIPSTPPCLQIYSPRGPLEWVHRVTREIGGHVFTPKFAKMHGKPKT
jgi:hypothetical protein